MGNGLGSQAASIASVLSTKIELLRLNCISMFVDHSILVEHLEGVIELHAQFKVGMPRSSNNYAPPAYLLYRSRIAGVAGITVSRVRMS